MHRVARLVRRQARTLCTNGQLGPAGHGTPVALSGGVESLAVTEPLPSMQDLARVATNLARASSLTDAVRGLQRDLAAVLGLTDARCLWIDWPRRAVWSAVGPVGERAGELVTDVAASGKRELVDNTLMQPVGTRPARAVFALRRGPGRTFQPFELAMISTLAFEFAPALDRLIASSLVRGTPR